MTEPDCSCFIFLIKTNHYAGNFEREMCAFMTGVRGECGVGDIAAGLYASKYPGDNPWKDKLLQLADEHGCYRPVSIWNAHSRDVAIFLEERPSEEEIEFLRKRAFFFGLDPRSGVGHSGDDSDTRIVIKGFELIEYKVERTENTVACWPPLDISEVPSE